MLGKVATVKQMIVIAVYHPGSWISHRTPTGFFVVAVMHIDQVMEPKDRAFQALLLVTSRDSVCEVQCMETE